jgi:hypothetical protein
MHMTKMKKKERSGTVKKYEKKKEGITPTI